MVQAAYVRTPQATWLCLDGVQIMVAVRGDDDALLGCQHLQSGQVGQLNALQGPAFDFLVADDVEFHATCMYAPTVTQHLLYIADANAALLHPGAGVHREGEWERMTRWVI